MIHASRACAYLYIISVPPHFSQNVQNYDARNYKIQILDNIEIKVWLSKHFYSRAREQSVVAPLSFQAAEQHYTLSYTSESKTTEKFC